MISGHWVSPIGLFAGSMAARNTSGSQNSGWQAAGTVTVP